MSSLAATARDLVADVLAAAAAGRSQRAPRWPMPAKRWKPWRGAAKGCCISCRTTAASPSAWWRRSRVVPVRARLRAAAAPAGRRTRGPRHRTDHRGRAGDPGSVAADAELLDQALINLVRNAIEALRDAPTGTDRADRPSQETGGRDRDRGGRQWPRHSARSARERSSCRSSPPSGRAAAWA